MDCDRGTHLEVAAGRTQMHHTRTSLLPNSAKRRAADCALTFAAIVGGSSDFDVKPPSAARSCHDSNKRSATGLDRPACPTQTGAESATRAGLGKGRCTPMPLHWRRCGCRATGQTI